MLMNRWVSWGSLVVIAEFIHVCGQLQVGWLGSFADLEWTQFEWLGSVPMSSISQQDNPGLTLSQSKTSKKTRRNKQDFSTCLTFTKATRMLNLKSKRRELFSPSRWEKLQSHVWMAGVQEGVSSWGYSHIIHIKNNDVLVAVGVVKNSHIPDHYGGQDDTIFRLTRGRVWEKEKSWGWQKFGLSKWEDRFGISWSGKIEQ